MERKVIGSGSAGDGIRPSFDGDRGESEGFRGNPQDFHGILTPPSDLPEEIRKNLP